MFLIVGRKVLSAGERKSTQSLRRRKLPVTARMIVK